MDFLKRFFSSPVEAAMKTIVYRGGVLTFRIPAHWREEYSDFEGGAFYEDRPDSGTLRLKVITMTSPNQPETGSAVDVLQVVVNKLKNEGVEGTIKALKDGNAVFRYEQPNSEHGQSLTIFYWVVSNPLPPSHVRVATFSYTILAEQRSHSKIHHDVAMIEAEIEAVMFSPEIGVVSE